MIRFGVLLLSFIMMSQTGQAAGQWYKCTVYASSHTGHYTFQISEKPCAVYWREIDTQLKITSCELPDIKALKPSALSEYDIVAFNLKTGQFYDYLSGVYDRGMCVKTEQP